MDAKDVKRYLQFFIQDKFKEWAEAEGDKAAELLELLAEDVIQITNENVHGVMDMVAERFGPADTKVELEVDTLRYDVGVFALGALGTTIFLFVNTFVGGLLTIAAPVLAVVVRERMGARIKSQAKEKGPEAIRKAADAIGPRFEDIVDQFAGRLIDFINNAGEALHRGISEVLDQALAERTAQENSVEELSADLDVQEAALKAFEERLKTLRTELWAEPVE